MTDIVSDQRVVALSGGIGGAKLALGFYRILDADGLTVVANPGDDFEHLGFTICPDFDTVLYTLADVVNTETGWGRKGESWNFMDSLKALGGENWFQLGDRDLALHAQRTHLLAAGESPTEIARRLVSAFDVGARLLPVCDKPVRTLVITPDGELAFQHYFVRDRAEPEVCGFRFDGASEARITAEVRGVLCSPDTAAIVLCPSNPFISIDPMLAVPGMIDALDEAEAPVVAVSPVIAGEAVKGPTAKMMAELGLEVSAVTVAQHYASIIDGFVLDSRDAHLAPRIDCATFLTNTLMKSLADRDRLAAEVLAFARTLG